MNAITYTEARAVNRRRNPAGSCRPTKNLILVPRRGWCAPRRNVRKTSRMSIPELAASIQRVGLLQT